jgi:IMP dehydrogenase
MATEIKEALTFDDVLLVPRYSEVLPGQVEVGSRVSREITLNIPLLSAAMDTVTEAQTAICMARHGGMGVIHKNMTPEQQAQEVRRVKKTESGMVVEPVTITPEHTLRDALALMHAYGFSGLPVVSGGKPVGILTSRDLRFETNLDQPVGGVMTRDPIAVPQGIALEAARQLLHKHRIEKLLVVDAKGELLGLITVKDILKAAVAPARDQGQRRAPARGRGGRGRGGPDSCRVAALVAEHVDVIVLDTAHGHSKGVLDAVRALPIGLPGAADRGRQHRHAGGVHGAV